MPPTTLTSEEPIKRYKPPASTPSLRTYGG